MPQLAHSTCGSLAPRPRTLDSIWSVTRRSPADGNCAPLQGYGALVGVAISGPAPSAVRTRLAGLSEAVIAAPAQPERRLLSTPKSFGQVKERLRYLQRPAFGVGAAAGKRQCTALVDRRLRAQIGPVTHSFVSKYLP